MATPELSTERLGLRPVRPADSPFLYALMGHREVRRYLGGPVTHLRRLANLLGLLKPHPGDAVWLVETGQRRIGLLSITRHKDGAEREVSYQFHPSAWGHGFATEAVGAALHASPHRPLIAETQVANAASRRLLGRVGMRPRTRLVRFGAEQIIYETA